MGRISGVLAIVVSLACGGCSFLFADSPPRGHEKMLYFDCTSTAGLEVADGVFGLGSVLTGIGTLSKSEAEYKADTDGGNRNAVAATNFAVAGVFVASAVYGIVVTENCRDAKADLRQRIIEREQRRAAPPSGPPVPPVLPPPAAPPVPTAPATPSPAVDTAPLPPPPAPSPAPSAAPQPAAPQQKPGSASF